VASMKTFYYLIGGEQEELGFSELKALLEIYDPSSKIIGCYTKICIVEHDKPIVGKILSRASYIKEAGFLIGLDDPLKPSYDYIDTIKEHNVKWIKPFNPYAIRSAHIVSRFVKELASKTGLSTYYCGKEYLHIIFTEEKIVVGKPVYRLNARALQDREPSKRPFFRSIALPPALSRLLINLSRVKEGEVLLDPFAGTGSILIEAGFMGIRGIGVEIDYELVHGMVKNISHYRLLDQIVVFGDSRELTYTYVDGVATDPPYGRAASTHGVDILKLYKSFLENMYYSVKKRGYVVFMAPYNLEKHIDELVCGSGLILKQKHYMYVHGSLTRIIYEVVRP